MTNPALTALTISNFRSVGGTVSVPLDAPVVLLHGVNGAGKSTVMSALELALTGDISGVQETDRGYLVHRGASHAEVLLSTKTGSFEIRIDGGNVSGTHLLDDASRQFFVERCHLQQRNLTRLLDLYESQQRSTRSALTEFVNDLLGLDEVEALLDGLYAVGHKGRVKRLIPAYAQLEDRSKALAEAVDLKSRELGQLVARAAAARASLLSQLTELGAPEGTELDESATGSWLEDLSLAEEGSLTALTGARREVRSLSTRIQQLTPSDVEKQTRTLEVDAEAAQDRGAAWRSATGTALSQLLDRTRRVLPGVPAWNGLADPAVIAGAAAAGIESEHQRLTAQLETDDEARTAAVQLQTALEAARSRLASLDLQLAEVSSADTLDTFGSALAALMPHIDGDNCPVCARDYREVSREPLTSHLASRISELTTQAKRLQDVARARVQAAADIRRIEAGVADQTRRLLTDDARGATVATLSELRDLTQALTSLRPDVEAGAELIRRETEARRELAEAADADQERADLLATLRQVGQQFGLSSNRPASLRDEADALADVIQAQITALEARAELNRQARRTVQAIRSISGAQREAEQDLGRDEDESRSISVAIKELDRRRSTLRGLRSEVERARTEIVQQVFTTSLNRMWRDLFARLAPEEAFVPSFGLPETNNRLVATLETVHRDGSSGGRPAAMLSAGNLNTAALTLFLALNLSVEARLPWILLDDPVQSMDEVHVSQLAALLRTLTRDHGRRVVIAVHERPLFDYLALELGPSNIDEALVAVDLTRGSDGSTIAEPTYHPFREDKAFASA